ncbi:hypothetical protein ACCI51_03055 [Microbulbifer echini]|uniref:Restriction endonuclease type IV Mrr domain-containing protein n=1 Tax=Microbulbifer echini TaxID=1529067 RepID=A0ABV4NJV2_9GAMM
MKFEFGDLYKFTVSLGVVIVILSTLAPWLFLKEPFDLYRPETEIKALSDTAKAVVAKRQNAVSFIVEFIPWFSSIGFIFGSIFIYLGLKNWHSNQIHIDEQTRLDVEIKKQSLRKATKDEIEEKEAVEYEDYKVAEESDLEAHLVSSLRRQYSKIEDLAYMKFSETYKDKYEVLRNMMVAGVELDILLKGKNIFTKDHIIEVKYIRKGFNFGWLREAYLKNIYAKSVYSQITNRLPNTLLLIVINSDVYNEEKYDRLLKKLRNEQAGRKEKDLVRMITKEDLAILDSTKLQETVAIS